VGGSRLSGGSRPRHRDPQTSNRSQPKPSTAVPARLTNIARQAGRPPAVYGARVDVVFAETRSGGSPCSITTARWIDIFIAGGTRFDSAPPDATNRLYHNNHDVLSLMLPISRTRRTLGPRVAIATTTMTARVDCRDLLGEKYCTEQRRRQ